MSLVAALALPVGKAVVSALIKRDPNQLSDVPIEAFAGFLKEVFAEVDAQAEMISGTYRLTVLSIAQDFDREYLSAVQIMKDSVRARTDAKRDEMYRFALELLVRAASGTRDPLQKSEALVTDAALGVMMGIPEHVADRAAQGWRYACTALLDNYRGWRHPVLPTPNLKDQLFGALRAGPDQVSVRIRRSAAERCIECIRIAEDASALLAACGVPGHPVSFRAPDDANLWHYALAAGIPMASGGDPLFAVFGGSSAALPDGDVVVAQRKENGHIVVTVESGSETSNEGRQLIAKYRKRDITRQSVIEDLNSNRHAFPPLSSAEAILLAPAEPDQVIDAEVSLGLLHHWRVILEPPTVSLISPAVPAGSPAVSPISPVKNNNNSGGRSFTKNGQPPRREPEEKALSQEMMDFLNRPRM